MNHIRKEPEEESITIIEPERVSSVSDDNKPVTNRIVPPHNKKSRLVKKSDVNRVVEEAKVLHELCLTPHGLYQGAFAVHHSQIDATDPMNFFVTAEKRIIINPLITRHSNYTKDSNEACITFEMESLKTVQRWQKIEVEYLTIMLDPEDKEKFKLSSLIQESLSGFDSFVFQHEVDHGQAKYLYQFLIKK